ncbi:outer membrane lipid asymmetry maintenance protein MlaD [Solimonas terrae]|uniref:Outer membrane lipid asymmetry maintenance protein MlaD n=1 Tax=Solimonas terrae TaxID=1396819 RepID=A0A6M2BVN4_9GAMM|nr:outer membrane lipid asymmetry maintenance protein MlaD [Solimonas terrae]NGY06712.1 outer membrane lipid asymmetry maintenance protein MlaD [Solimonas terrae]
MQSRALEILVGFFVCLGVAAVFVLTFRVASLDTVGNGDGVYRVSALFQNIGGLKAGAAVSMAGVKIGRVRDIAIDPQSFEARVSMDISRQYSKIPEDSSAKILTAGLLGEQYIGLEPGGMDDYLQDGSEITLTQSALVLENLIGQFLASQGESKDDKLADAIGKLADSLQAKNKAPASAASGATK